jgi:hypothetical protein
MLFELFCSNLLTGRTHEVLRLAKLGLCLHEFYLYIHITLIGYVPNITKIMITYQFASIFALITKEDQ